jgi:hypothetical protein
MSISLYSSRTFAAIAVAAPAVAALLTACSTPSGTATATIPAAVSENGAQFAQNSKLTEFVSDWDNDVVDVIQGGVAVKSIDVTGPEGLAVDAAGNLYVTNVAASDVLVYAPPYKGAPAILDDAGYRPNGVAVDANGNVAVTSAVSTGYGPGSVAFFSRGATEPSRVIVANGRFAGDYYCAFDSAGNLFLTSMSGNGPFAVGEVAGGISGTAVRALKTRNVLDDPAGIQVTHDDKIAILNAGSNGATIYTYNAPKGAQLGNPIATTELGSSENALAFAFAGKNDKYVVTADTFFTDGPRRGARPAHEDQIGQAQSFAYPQGGGAVQQVRLEYNATMTGVAVSPASK